MNSDIKQVFADEVAREPYARKLGMKLVEIGEGSSKVEMVLTTDMENLLGMTHGGAIFSLMDEAFQTACNSHGTLAVALSLNVVYTRPPEAGSTLTAIAEECNRGVKTGLYEIRVVDDRGRDIARCQALAYRKGTPLPFLNDVD